MSDPHISYARTSDGVSIAYSIMGEGLPLVFASNVMGDLHWYTHNEGTRRQVDTLVAAGCSVIRYDMRGMGSSDRDVRDFSVGARVQDLVAVVEAVGLKRFALCGYAHGCAAAIEYADAEPGRVSHLALVNPYATGAAYYEKVPGAAVMIELHDMAERNWDFFTLTLASAMTDHVDPEAAKRTAALFRAALSPSVYVSFAKEARETNLSQSARRLKVPTIVVVDSSPSSHPDLGKSVAAMIRDARLAITKDYVRDLIAFLGLRAPAPPAHDSVISRAPSKTAVILFVDIADSTALTERLGDVGFRERSRALDHALRLAVHDNGGMVIDAKTLGDGILATFSAASQAIAAAQVCAATGEPHDLSLHLGIHAGDVLREQDNVYGGAVNIAARICGLSAPGEILVSDIVRGLARTSAGVTFADRGEHALKGIEDPVRVFAVGC